MTRTWTKRDADEFRAYLKGCTDRQVVGVYDKEREAGRWEYAALAEAEMELRNAAAETRRN